MTETMTEGFEINVKGPQGHAEKLTICCNRVVVGSGAHCEVRLPVDHAAAEHVELTVSAGRVHARARAFEPAPTLAGSPFVQAIVEPGTWVGVGPFQILAAPVALAGGAEVAVKKAGTRRPLVVGVAVAALALLAVALAKRSDGSASGPPIDAPALWAAAATPVTCPQASPGQAMALAREKSRFAEGKRERRPFSVRDGVVAVQLFETAGACYSAAGDADAAASSTQAASTLRGKVQEDYHAHQVRLEHALFVHDNATAQHEVKVLRAFTEGTSGAYTAWLSDLDRRLHIETAKEHTT